MVFRLTIFHAMTTATSVSLPEFLAAVRELSRAARWETALRLLDGLPDTDSGARARIALTAAEVALEQDWYCATDSAAARIEAAHKELGDGDWDLSFVRLRHTYGRLLLVDGALRLGPEGKDPAALAALRRTAHQLHDSAPDSVRRGWASMYLGLIADNQFAERSAAPAHYEAALRAAESGADDLLAREALRHLGDHDHDDGDHDRALHRWQRATALGAGAGTVPGTLTQQILLAILARDTGDEPAARGLATEVARWAEAIGATRVAAQATAVLAGQDPTAAPPQTGA